MAFVNLNIGGDRIVLTAFNPSTDLTLLKCRFVLEQIEAQFHHVREDDFRSWVSRQEGGAELLAAMDAGALMVEHDWDRVDPLNARQEVRIISYLMEERRSQRRGRGGSQ